MVVAICSLNHHAHDSIPTSISLRMHDVKLSTKELSVNCVFRTGVNVELEGDVGPIHTRDVERILGAASCIFSFDPSIAEGECQVSNGTVSVLFLIRSDSD